MHAHFHGWQWFDKHSSACNNYPSLSFPLPYVVGNRKEQTWKAQAVLLEVYMEPEIFSTLTLLLCQLWKRAWVASRCGQLRKNFFGYSYINTLPCMQYWGSHWFTDKFSTVYYLHPNFCLLVAHRSSTEEGSSGSDCSLSGETHKKPVLSLAALLRYHQWPVYIVSIFHVYTLL